jgi:hypothetical protein
MAAGWGGKVVGPTGPWQLASWPQRWAMMGNRNEEQTGPLLRVGQVLAHGQLAEEEIANSFELKLNLNSKRFLVAK